MVMVNISCQLDRNFVKKQTSCRPLEEQMVQRNTDSGGPAHEVSEGNKGSIGNWANGCPFDNLLWLHSVHVPSAGVRLISGVMGWLGGEKSQARTAFTPRHGYRSHPATEREQMNGAEGSGKCACCLAM